jgi:peptidoglycan/xylan/chitin deacetylase (PgdA/CDA1 family)
MRAGGAEIGSHTYSHLNLARLDPADALRELRLSKDILEDRLQERVTSFAYPFGKPRRHVAPETVDAVAEAGYRTAVVTTARAIRPSDAELEFPRLTVTGDNLDALRQKVFGAWDFLGWWQERAPLWAVRMMRPGDARF